MRVLRRGRGRRGALRPIESDATGLSTERRGERVTVGQRRARRAAFVVELPVRVVPSARFVPDAVGLPGADGAPAGVGALSLLMAVPAGWLALRGNPWWRLGVVLWTLAAVPHVLVRRTARRRVALLREGPAAWSPAREVLGSALASA
jgi:hypothetical protein